MNMTMRKALLALGAAGFVGLVAAGVADNTSSGYKPTIGGPGSVAGVVIQQSNDGSTSIPINSAHPLPVTVSGGGGGASTIADGADVAEGAKADAAATDSTSSWTVIALLKGLWAKLSTIATNTTGASTAANQTAVQSAAGTPNTTAITVQGNASGVSLPVSGTVAVASADGTATGTLTANGQRVSLALNGHQGASITASGGSSMLVIFQASYDGGATWVGIDVIRADQMYARLPASAQNIANATFLPDIPPGATHVGITCNFYVSGTATINIRATDLRQNRAVSQPTFLDGISDGNTLRQFASINTFNTDTITPSSSFAIALPVAAEPYLVSSSNNQLRQYSASATNIANQNGVGAALTEEPGQWFATNTPATATQATVSKSAGASGVRHVAKTVSGTLCAGASAPTAAAPLSVNLRDGATGAGTVIWSSIINVPATAGQCAGFTLSGLNIPGTAATAMTIEFSAAGATNTYESVSMTGYDAQ